MLCDSQGCKISKLKAKKYEVFKKNLKWPNQKILPYLKVNLCDYQALHLSYSQIFATDFMTFTR